MLRVKAFENIGGKGEKAFSPFPTIFSALSKTEIVIVGTFYLLSANAFNLNQS